jgi:hypothetical protein
MNILQRYPKTASLIGALVLLYALMSVFLRATSFTTAGGS